MVQKRKEKTLEQFWNDRAAELLEGRVIQKAFYQSAAEATEDGWPCRALVLVLGDGSRCIVATDPEGNGPGCLQILAANGEFERLGPL